MNCPCCDIDMVKKIDNTVVTAGFGWQCPKCKMIKHEDSNYHPITDEEWEELMSMEIDPPSDEELEEERLKRSMAKLSRSWTL